MEEKNFEIKNKSDSINIPLPKNKWMVTSVFLGVVVLVLLFMQFSGGITGNVISKNTAAENLISFLNENAPSEVTLKDVSTEYGMYKVNVNFQGEVIPVYVTKDGKYMASLQPLVMGGTNAGGNNVKVDVSEDDDAVLGKVDAPVTIIEFSDYECPFCEKFFTETYPQLKKDYVDTGKVKIVFRDFPLSFHPNAQKAAEAAECAGEQGGNTAYFKMHDKLFQNQNDLSVNSLKKYAKEIGLDTAKFNSCLDSGKMASEIQKDESDGQAAGVSGTPAFFINGKLLEGAQPYSAFKKVIDEELANTN